MFVVVTVKGKRYIVLNTDTKIFDGLSGKVKIEPEGIVCFFCRPVKGEGDRLFDVREVTKVQRIPANEVR